MADSNEFWKCSRKKMKQFICIRQGIFVYPRRIWKDPRVHEDKSDFSKQNKWPSSWLYLEEHVLHSPFMAHFLRGQLLKHKNLWMVKIKPFTHFCLLQMSLKITYSPIKWSPWMCTKFPHLWPLDLVNELTPFAHLETRNLRLSQTPSMVIVLHSHDTHRLLKHSRD